MPTAKGPFEVKVTPIEAYNTDSSAKLGRMSLDKQFHGDLEATSKGEMLSAMGEIQGSAAAVAVERVTGSLAGKSGSFALYHVGVMEAGTPKYWRVNVAPDSGTGALTGIKGEMKIIIEGKSHSYEFDYELP
jgi:Protein of unknown function (DUF3224)